MKKMCILLLSRMFCIYLIGSLCYSAVEITVFSVICCVDDLSVVTSEVVKSPNIVYCITCLFPLLALLVFMYLDNLMLGA